MPLTRNKRKRKIRSIRKTRGRKTRGRKIKRNYRNKRKLSRKGRKKKMKKRNRTGKGILSFLSRNNSVHPVISAENHHPLCTICQGPIHDTLKRYCTERMCTFHDNCILGWCQRKKKDAKCPNCPNCRRPLNCNGPLSWDDFDALTEKSLLDDEKDEMLKKLGIMNR